MKLELFPFQREALFKLRGQVANALGEYNRHFDPQVISFTAPTGAGKTIIMTSLIEDIFYGTADFIEQPNAIFLWLSDSPELNEQSKMKIQGKSDKIRLNQCITISDVDFNQEVLDDGKIYFLNTQKLGRSSNLTEISDTREWTIWQTLENTLRDKSNRFYVIIDEAHRGAYGKKIDVAITIMQKFIKGDKYNSLSPMPIVIGMSATIGRFNELVTETSSTRRSVAIPIEKIRTSGLLKDRIIITYPENKDEKRGLSILSTATKAWLDKWDRWTQYTTEQHYAHVNPIFLIQVENRNGKNISATDLDMCLRIIEKASGRIFTKGEVVHSFGEKTSSIDINGLEVIYEEPSFINDNRRIKVVFFKESLSTGWDCPRAEVMMSFRPAKDATYIAQLLGRMVRTPMQSRIAVDETLNNVDLFLPNFDEHTVNEVVSKFQESEGDSGITEVLSQDSGHKIIETWTVARASDKSTDTLLSGNSLPHNIDKNKSKNNREEVDFTPSSTLETDHDESKNIDYDINKGAVNLRRNKDKVEPIDEMLSRVDMVHDVHESYGINNRDIDYNGIVRFINDLGLSTYKVRNVKINSYLKSLFDLVWMLNTSNIDNVLLNNVRDDIADEINNYINNLKERNEYEKLYEAVKEFRLKTRIMDPFGEEIDNVMTTNLFSITDYDIELQFRQAEKKLNDEGVGQYYGDKFTDYNDDLTFKIDTIIYAHNNVNLENLELYAKGKFHELTNRFRRHITTLTDNIQNKFSKIVKDGDIVSEHNWKIPEDITMAVDTTLPSYENHLFVTQTGKAYIDLNGWEKETLTAEEKRDDFVCWLRNPPRASWSLLIPYEKDNEIKSMYPDLIIIRKDDYTGYVVDILEPHGDHFSDNIGKVKGLAKYARDNPKIGRVQLIRIVKVIGGKSKIQRLNLSQVEVRDRVIRINAQEELATIFNTYGVFE